MGTASMPVTVLIAGRALASIVSAFKGEAHPSKLLTDISFAGYNSRFPKEEGIHAWISSDREVVKKYDSDPFCSYTFSAGGFGVLYDTIYALERKRDFENIRKDLPVLVVAGEEDPVGNYSKGVLEVEKKLKKQGLPVKCVIYKGARHEILGDFTHDAVVSEILEFVR